MALKLLENESESGKSLLRRKIGKIGEIYGKIYTSQVAHTEDNKVVIIIISQNLRSFTSSK